MVFHMFASGSACPRAIRIFKMVNVGLSFLFYLLYLIILVKFGLIFLY